MFWKIIDMTLALSQSPLPLGALVITCSLLLLGLWHHGFKQFRYPLPPSPPGDWFLGHFRKLPHDNVHLKHMQYAKEYNSDVVYFNVLGNHMIVLNSAKVANEILDKRGANYQDRPRFVLFEVMGWGLTLTFLPYGPRFRLHRSAFQTGFSKTAIINYQPIQEDEARQAVLRILRRPENWDNSLRRFASAIVLRIGFGAHVKSDNDPYIKIATDANMATVRGGSPGTALVDYLPIFRYVPNWLNFSQTLRHAREWGWAIKRLHDVPFAATLKQFEANEANPSFATSLLTRFRENERNGISNDMTITDIQGASGAVFIAGSNTTLATATVALLNMMLNPDVFKKAREEIDKVVGTNRLPSLADRPKLRYIDYLVEEATRWRPLSTIGIPHKSLEDDTYNGMFIPKGTYVYYNNFAISRDTTVYKDPERFNPDRYAPVEEGGDGEPFIVGPFGFGRRICPGRHLAQASVWILMATLIATTDISKPVGKDGKPIEQDIVFSTGLSSHPGKFDVAFKSRSENAKQLLMDVVGDTE